MTQKPDNPPAFADKVALVKELDAKRDDICNSLVPSDIRMMQALIAQQDAIIQKQREVLGMAREDLDYLLRIVDEKKEAFRDEWATLTAIDNVMKVGG